MATPYSDVSKINLDQQRLIELTDNAGAPDVKDDALINDLGLDANDMIDARLKGKWVVPLVAPIDPAIQIIHRQLWRYLLYSHRETMQMPEVIASDYKEALRELDKYADTEGDRVLDHPLVQSSTGPSPTGGVLERDLCRMFGRGRDRLGG